MLSIFFVVIIGIIAGVAVGLQSPMASIITQRLGIWESIFIVHFGGAVASIIPLMAMGGGQLNEWRRTPLYTLSAGVLGLMVITGVTFMIPRIGAASATIVLITGQLLVGAVLDHFGWMGVTERPLDLSRIIGLLVVFIWRLANRQAIMHTLL
jgi:transporter family-2 protein